MIELEILILAFKCVYEGRVPIIAHVKVVFANDMQFCEPLVSLN